MEAAECGAACLGMVLAYYGLWITSEELRENCGVGRDGSRAANILLAAMSYNCDADGYQWTAEDLKELAESGENIFPLILFWQNNHFVVLEGFEKDKVRLNDPSMGRRKIFWKKFCNSYSEIALYIKPNKNFQPSKKPQNIVYKISKKIFTQNKKVLPVLILLSLFLVLPTAALPLLYQIYVDNIITRQHTDWLPWFDISVGILFLLSALIAIIRNRILNNLKYRLALTETAEDFGRLLNLPLSFFRHRFASELAVQANVGAEFSQFIVEKFILNILNILVASCYFILLFLCNPLLALIGLFLNLISVGAFYFTQNKLRDLSVNIKQNAAKKYTVLFNGLKKIESLKISGGEWDFFSRYLGFYTKELENSQKAAYLSLPLKTLPYILAGINGALIMVIGAFSVMEGVMTAGMYLAFLQLMYLFQETPNKLDANFNLQIQQKKDLEDTKKIFADNENSLQENVSSCRLRGEILLKNITFGYNKTETPLINNLTLKISAGESVALVGKSGSGKSTVAKIAAGLIDAWSGEIYFDNENVLNISKGTLAASVAAVDQDISFISGTIAENIAMFDKTISRSDIVRAAQDACIHDDIIKLNGGYDAKIKEGGKNFSGGERQRLEIARALAINPSVLILDEATSALDAITEKQVLTNIRRRGLTCLMVAHRLSTIKACDKIFTLDDGCAVESGSHSELMKCKGAYWKLVKRE